MEWHRQPTGRLLLLAFQAFERRLLAALRRAGHGAVSLSHLNVFRHLSAEGCSLVQLAAAVGLSKQAVGKIVAELAALDYVVLTADERDARAKRVRFSARGSQLAHTVQETVRLMEREYLSLLADDYHRLRRSLRCVLQSEPGRQGDAWGDNPA